jgi:hypothetical protein
MAQGVLPERVAVPVLHTRPSKIVRIFREQRLTPEGVSLMAVDSEGTIMLIGTGPAIAETKSRLALFDNQARKVGLRLFVESPLDHAEWKADLQISNNSRWAGKDERTGIDLALSPRLNDDGTATVILRSTSADIPAIEVIFRLKLGETTVVGCPVDGKIQIGPGAAKVNGPRISVTFVEEPK